VEFYRKGRDIHSGPAISPDDGSCNSTTETTDAGTEDPAIIRTQPRQRNPQDAPTGFAGSRLHGEGGIPIGGQVV